MTHPTTDALYDAIGSGITSQDPEGVLLRWLDGAGSLLGEVDDVVRDGPVFAGWAGELTSEGSHRVPWTGQLLGVIVPDGLTDGAARALVQDRPATRRGTVAALIAAALPFLTGTQYIDVRERDGGAYRLTVETFIEETPDPAAVEAALRAAKPAGLALTYRTAVRTSYTALEAEAPQTYTALEAEAAQTYTAKEA